MDFSTRIVLLQQQIPNHTALLVSDPAHLFYLTGIPQLNPEEKEGFLIASANQALCILTPFAPNPSIKTLPIQTLSSQTPLSQILQQWCLEQKIDKIQLDASTLFLAEYEILKKNLTDLSLESISNDPIDTLRMSKSSEELEHIKKANTLTHRALQTVQKKLTVGMTEKQIKVLLENYLREHEVDQMAFPTIVAFGEHSAKPHHQPTERKLKENEPVLIDIGAKWKGYCADVTRTWWFGEKPSQQFSEIEKIIHRAYSSTLQRCNLATYQPLIARDLDNIARSIISDAGFGQQFIHTTGHGVGIIIHEPPSLNWKNDLQLPNNCVITIEPGIYIDGKFGYRFENSIALTQQGAKELL